LIPDNVTTIGNYAFNGCSSLESVTFSNTMTSIGYMAFRYCSSLESITIPSSITTINDKAFEKCNNLTSVTVEKEEPVSIADDVFTNRTNANLFVPAGCVGKYKAANYWKEFKNIVGLGDANGDGFIDTQDAIKGIQYYLGKNPEDFDTLAADVNGDGVVDTQDAILIIKMYLKK